MNEYKSQMLPGGLKQDHFPTVRKGGYDKSEVDAFVIRTLNEIRDLRERLARMDDEREQLKRDLAVAKEKSAVKPEHEQISERMAEILRIAEEEAKERRSKVEAEVKEIRDGAQKDCDKRRKDAEEHAERVVSTARTEANEMVSSAKQEADQLREQAKQEGDRRLSDAEARAKKIHDTADRRLAMLTATHNEAVRRLSDMHSTLDELLAAERKAGALETGLSKEEIADERAKAPAPSGREQAPAKPGQGRPEQARPGQAAPAAPAKEAPSPAGAVAGAKRPADDEPTAKLPPVQDADEATIRITPLGADDEKTEKIPSHPVRNSPRPQQPAPQPAAPQGARFSGPAPQDAPAKKSEAAAGAADRDANDPGVTGVYHRPGGQEDPAAKDGDEGVRVVKKP